MVLSASPAADAPSGAIRDGRWIERIVRHLELTNRGILLLVNRAQPWNLAPLLQRLDETFGEVQVHTRASELARLPPGSTVVLVPHGADAEALNMARPLFSRNELRVVLFCEADVAEVLRRHAPDFFDWLSLVVDCPQSPPPHIVYALRTAITTRARAIAWISDDSNAESQVQAMVAEVENGTTFSNVDPRISFESFVDSIRSASERGDWLQARIERSFHLRRLEWALGELDQRVPVVAIVPKHMRSAAYQAGFFLVRGATASIATTRNRLAIAGARKPERLAAWLRGDPDAVDLAVRLLDAIVDEEVFERVLRAAENPSLALVEIDSMIARGMRRRVSYEDVGRALRQVEPIFYVLGPRQWDRNHFPGQIALRAFRLGDFDAGHYFARRSITTNSRDDETTREMVREWLDELGSDWKEPTFDELPPVDTADAEGAWLYQHAAPTFWSQWPGRTNEHVERRILIEQLASRLDPKDFELLRDYLWDSDWVEMASALGTSPDAVRARFKRIVKRFRAILEDDEE